MKLLPYDQTTLGKKNIYFTLWRVVANIFPLKPSNINSHFYYMSLFGPPSPIVLNQTSRPPPHPFTSTLCQFRKCGIWSHSVAVLNSLILVPI